MTPTPIRPVQGHDNNTPAAKSGGVDYNTLVAEGKAQVRLLKPKKPVSASDFGRVADTESGTGPKVDTCEFTVMADGRMAIVLPKRLEYEFSRDTTSASRRSFYCMVPKGQDIDGVIHAEIDGEDTEIPVTFRLTTGFSMSAAARVVSE